MVKFYLDKHTCSIDSGKLPLYVKLIFWKQWATNFESPSYELRDVCIKRRAGITTLIVNTNRKRVPIYLGISNSEAEHILQKIQDGCVRYRAKMVIV